MLRVDGTLPYVNIVALGRATGRGLLLVVLMGAPILIGGLAGLWWPTTWAVAAVIGSVLVAVLLAGAVASYWWTTALMCLLAITAGAVATMAPLAVLNHRGERLTATVADRDVVSSQKNNRSSRTTYHYQFKGPDGAPIAGEVVQHKAVWDIGDRVDLVVDPQAHVDPAQPRDLRYETPLELVALIGGALLLVLCFVAGYAGRPS